MSGNEDSDDTEDSITSDNDDSGDTDNSILSGEYDLVTCPFYRHVLRLNTPSNIHNKNPIT